jgi:hypothetical protein
VTSCHSLHLFFLQLKVQEDAECYVRMMLIHFQSALNHKAYKLRAPIARIVKLIAQVVEEGKNIFVKERKAKTSIGISLAIAILTVSLSSGSIVATGIFEDEVTYVKMEIDEGLEIIKSKSYSILDNVKWNDVKATGLKVTKTSLKGFCQICERIGVNLGNLQVYADFEARVMWVYSNPTAKAADREVYYVQFTGSD